MKRILLSTAAVIALTGTAFAQDASTTVDTSTEAGVTVNDTTNEAAVDATVDAAADVATDAADTATEAADEATDAAAEAAASADAAVTTEAEADAEVAMHGPEMAMDGYTAMVSGDVTAELLAEAEVYTTTEDSIGSVSDIVLTADGQIDSLIVDVGGFLGIGAKPVAVDFDLVTILKDDDGDEVRVYVDASAESLEAMPAYEG